MSRSYPLLLLAAVALTGAACGGSGDQIRVYDVTGQVLVDGKPAPLARVSFHPQGGDEKLQKLRPIGECDLEGNFELTTYEHEDGAPPGDYKVTVVWKGPDPGTDPNANINIEELNRGPDRLGEAYSDAATTSLTATVEKGGGTLPPFELKSAPAAPPKRR